MFQLLAFVFFCESAVIHLQDRLIRVDLAKTEEQQMRGLMGRTKLDDDEGMLFVYKEPRILRFWMKGMKIPISIGFFDEQKVLINVLEMPLPGKRERLLKEYYSSKTSLYALEMPPGWFERYNIVPGARFEWSE